MTGYTPGQQRAIREKTELLKRVMDGSYSMGDLCEKITRKRVAWFEKHKEELRVMKEFGSLCLFTLIPYLYSGYMKINPDDYDRHIWDDEDHGNIFLEIHSRNFCPYLEACKKLGLDTRVVCKEVLERPVQEVVSLVSPRSRFFRHYRNGIRPYNDCCTEIVAINPTSDEYWEFWKETHPDEYAAIQKLNEG
jgi:hypothetical protein